MKFILALIPLLSRFTALHVTAFVPAPISNSRTSFLGRRGAGASQFGVGGGVEYNAPSSEQGPSPQQRQQFDALFNQVVNCQVREDLPSILTRNIDLLVDLRGDAGISLFREVVVVAENTQDPEYIERTTAAVDYIVYFVETFVSEAKIMDDRNKELLGKIFRCMTADMPLEQKQDEMVVLMRAEKESFTPGFMRHLQAECQRFAQNQAPTAETAQMLEVMQIIQMRVIEELGDHLGEGAQVLGQLLGYSNSAERLAVLDAGLQVRGFEFATELKAMTAEALVGFSNTPGGVDQNLVSIIQEIDFRIDGYMRNN